tara:strand:- start:773 stop:1996 length:1224 start_codon:yes stop_codon:yes gene_type:complete
MALLTENNRQYYEGAQSFIADAGGTAGQSFTTTFDTDLVFGAAINTNVNYALNNFKLYTSPTGVSGSYSEFNSAYTVSGNTITVTGALAANTVVVVQLKKLDGGNYGNTVADKAFGTTVEDNYGSYSYIKLNDIVNNFLVAYVGAGKLIPNVKRTDVIFHTKRAIQEFSYDTLRSRKSQELTVPKNLSVVLPQDYVNYINIYWVDQTGRQHIIMPTNNLHQSPTELPIQDNKGVPIQDSFNNNIESASSIIDDRWNKNGFNNQINLLNDPLAAAEFFNDYIGMVGYGQQYGLEPQYANINGYFNINDRINKISFSNNLVDKIINLEYISDGLSSDLDTEIPKMAEEAMYAYILHAIISTKINQPEYVVQRLKKEKSAKLRNAKIRLSNIKLNEFVQVMRGKSKWIKH